MKKLAASILLALVFSIFGASVVFADGGQYIVDKMDKQRIERQADAGAPCYDQSAKDRTGNAKTNQLYCH